MSASPESRIANPAVPRACAAAVVVIAGIIYALVWLACLKTTGGHFTYALDDPYIHLAIAKNLAFHGVWGVTPFAPASASSSPLWTSLLALAIRIAGNSVYWPVALGIVFSLAATLLVFRQFNRAGIIAPLAAICALGVFAIGPLQVLPFTGMEHSLQVFLDLIYGFWLIGALTGDHKNKELLGVAVLVGLMCLSRYEDAFLTLAPIAACVLKRNWRLAAAVAGGVILGIGIFALYSRLNGMPPVPNSILLKGNLPKTTIPAFFETIGARTLMLIHSTVLELWDLLVMATACALTMRFTRLNETTKGLQLWIWTIVCAAVCHCALALAGIFYRYEAYLIVSLFTVVVLSIQRLITFEWPAHDAPMTSRQWILAIAGVTAAQIVLARVLWFYQLNVNLIIFLYLIGLILLGAMTVGALNRGRFARVLLAAWSVGALVATVQNRALTAMKDVPKACSDIYLQQYQMSRFVARYYPDGRLAANDIGAVTYFSHVHLLDLMGLASDRVRRLLLKHTYSTATLGAEIYRYKPDLIIAYPDWFTGRRSLPATLIPVVHWTIPPITTAACRTVSFYALTPEAAERLRGQLKQFQPELPSRVQVDYFSLPKPAAGGTRAPAS